MVAVFTAPYYSKTNNQTKLPTNLCMKITTDNTNKIPEISIVVLCYQAGDQTKPFVANTIKIMEDANIFDYELVLVGNYRPNTPDTTPAVVAELALANPKIKYVAKEKKGMMGWDMKSGLAAANGNYLAVIDGDGQMPIEDLVKVYNKIKNNGLDLVKTYRIQRGDSAWRKIISFIYNRIFSILFPGTKSCDINSKPKIFTRAVYNKFELTADDWFLDAEIMIQSRRLGLKIFEIPTHFRGLEDRKSFVKTTTIFEFIKNLVIYRISEFKHRKVKI